MDMIELERCLVKRKKILFIFITFFTVSMTFKDSFGQSAPESIRFNIKILEINHKKVRARATGNRVDGLPLDNTTSYHRITAKYNATFSGVPQGNEKEKFQWIDQLTFSWSVILACSESGKSNDLPSLSRSVLMNKNVTYANIKAGKSNTAKHYAVLYIEPNLFERYDSKLTKDGVFVKLKVLKDNKLISSALATSKFFSTKSNIPFGVFPFSEEDNWFDSKAIKRNDSGLKNRLQTPWAWASYSSYESIISVNK